MIKKEDVKMKIAIGSDHGGYWLKENLKIFLKTLKIDYKDFGCISEEAVDYPDVALKVSNEVKNGKYEKGILICGTGIGMSIVANKIKGIRAALCSDVFSAKMTREHNDANILTLGGRVIGSGLAREIVKAWLFSDFSNVKRHINRINKIKKIEE
jgi:ribose 5-phosphate isomerase B